MDFTNRGAQPQASRSSAASASANNTTNSAGNGSGGFQQSMKKLAKNSQEPRWVRLMTVILLFSLTILAVSLAMLFYFGNPSESKFINTKKVQAVFLTNGQVYFGSVKEMSPKFLDLENIYYLNSQQAQPDQGSKDTSQQTNFSLVKLGCELHGPYDQMIINRDQVVFWENLRDDGQVGKAIEQWQQQNPNGQQCKTTTQSSSSSNATSSNTSATTPATTSNTPATTTTKK